MEPIKIFYCCTPKDRNLRDQLEKHLMTLKRLKQITLRLTRDILAGTDWSHEQNERFQKADLILLLVSPDFINSDYHYGIEMHNALEKHEAGNVWVIPIILRPTLWEKTPIGKLQALPKDGKAITTRRSRDAAFVAIVKEIGEVVAILLTQKQALAFATNADERTFPKFTQVIGLPCITCGARNPLGRTICENCGDLLLTDAAPQQDTNKFSTLGMVKINQPQQDDSKFCQNVALVIDHSGSMKGAGQRKVKDYVKMVIDRLEPTDIISVVIFDDIAQVIIPSLPANDKLGMKAVIDRIQSNEKGVSFSIKSEIHTSKGDKKWALSNNDNNTTMSRGMIQGLEELRRRDIPNAIKRMILLTDGITHGDRDHCRRLARVAAAEGVVIRTFGIGTNWDKDLLDDIAELSDGTHAEFLR